MLSLWGGPGYTYSSGDVRTIVDYVLMDVEAVSLMSSCHPMEDLNMSDHLPITACLIYDVGGKGGVLSGSVL